MHARIRLPAVLLVVTLAVVACASPGSSSEPPESDAPTSTVPSAEAATEVGVTFTGTAPEGWVLGDDGIPTPDSESAFFELHQNQAVMSADCSFGPEEGIGTAAADIVDALSDREGLNAGDRQDVTVGGLSGEQLDFAAAADGSGATCEATYVPLFGAFDANDQWLFVGAASGETHRLVALDVPGGGNVLVWIYASAPAATDEYLEAATEVLNGLEFDLP